MNNLWESFGGRSPPQIAPKLFTGGFEKPRRDSGLNDAAMARDCAVDEVEGTANHVPKETAHRLPNSGDGFSTK